MFPSRNGCISRLFCDSILREQAETKVGTMNRMLKRDWPCPLPYGQGSVPANRKSVLRNRAREQAESELVASRKRLANARCSDSRFGLKCLKSAGGAI